MGNDVVVELADLRGYADVIDEIGGYLKQMAGHAETYCTRTDFGPLLEPMGAAYVQLLPQIKAALAEQVSRMQSSAVAIDATLMDLRSTDLAEAARHGTKVAITNDGNSATYYGNPMTDYRVPSPSESELPEINFGFPFDQLAWALDKVCGYDVRREVTDYLVGDVVEVSAQAATWYSVGSGASSYSWYLDNANTTVAKTWKGDAFESTSAAMTAWVTTLAKQHTDLHQVAQHLEEIASDAVQMAQLAVDLIMMAIDMIASAWATQWIPVYGQVKFAKKAWDAYHLVKKAWDKLQDFLDVLSIVVGALEVIYNEFHQTSLPAAPTNG